MAGNFTMANILSQSVIDGTIASPVTKDQIAVTAGKISDIIVANSVFRDLVNTRYSTAPEAGGSVKVDRFALASSQNYGTARVAGAGNVLKNNWVKVDIDTHKEMAEEMSAIDISLYREGGALALLTQRQPVYAAGMQVELESAYFTALEAAATSVTATGTDLQDKITSVIQALESVNNDNVKGVDRSLMVMTLKPEIYDSLEKAITSFANPLTGRTDEKYFRRVAVRPALRQSSDIVIQVVGSVAQPVVVNTFKVETPDFSDDKYSFLSYWYGTKVVMADLVVKSDL